MQCIIMENLLNSEELKIESLHMKEWHTCFDSKHIFLSSVLQGKWKKKSFIWNISFFHVFWEWNIFEKKKKI